MPKDHSRPVNEADRQARAAYRSYDNWLARESIHDQRIPNINPRTHGRILAGERDVPPGLARERAEAIRLDMEIARERETLEGWALALELWAADCDTRSKGQRHA